MSPKGCERLWWHGDCGKPDGCAICWMLVFFKQLFFILSYRRRYQKGDSKAEAEKQ